MTSKRNGETIEENKEDDATQVEECSSGSVRP
jgi:hypothetical protein